MLVTIQTNLTIKFIKTVSVQLLFALRTRTLTYYLENSMLNERITDNLYPLIKVVSLESLVGIVLALKLKPASATA